MFTWCIRGSVDSLACQFVCYYISFESNVWSYPLQHQHFSKAILLLIGLSALVHYRNLKEFTFIYRFTKILYCSQWQRCCIQQKIFWQRTTSARMMWDLDTTGHRSGVWNIYICIQLLQYPRWVSYHVWFSRKTVTGLCRYVNYYIWRFYIVILF